jgi:hypothetical protein
MKEPAPEFIHLVRDTHQQRKFKEKPVGRCEQCASAPPPPATLILFPCPECLGPGESACFFLQPVAFQMGMYLQTRAFLVLIKVF